MLYDDNQIISMVNEIQALKLLKDEIINYILEKTTSTFKLDNFNCKLDYFTFNNISRAMPHKQSLEILIATALLEGYLAMIYGDNFSRQLHVLFDDIKEVINKINKT